MLNFNVDYLLGNFNITSAT